MSWGDVPRSSSWPKSPNDSLTSWLQYRNIQADRPAYDYFRLLETYRRDCSRMQFLAEDIWRTKFAGVADSISLDHLTLDLRDAIKPDGQHWGLDLASLLARHQKFTKGYPLELIILAPEEYLANMYAIIELVNGLESPFRRWIFDYLG